MLTFFGLVGFVLFGWSVVGLLSPRLARIRNRWVSIPIWFVSFFILMIVASIRDAEKRDEIYRAERAEAAKAKAEAKALALA